jgi:hypothetical protein
MKSPTHKTAINEVLKAIERLEPPCTIEFKSAGMVAPTIIDIVPDTAGGYSLDVGFRIGGGEPATVRAATPKEAAAVLGAEGGKNLGKLRRREAKEWSKRVVAFAGTEATKDPTITNRELTGRALDRCQPCPEYDQVYKVISSARRTGGIPPRQKKLATKRHTTRNKAPRA